MLAKCLVFNVMMYLHSVGFTPQVYCCTYIVIVLEKYTLGLDLPPQNVLRCVLLTRRNIRKSMRK